MALLMHGFLLDISGKMGVGILRYAPERVACVLDREHAGKTTDELLPGVSRLPIVATVEEALNLGGDILTIGIAPPGGRLPENFRDEVFCALELGMSFLNPLHERCENDPEYQRRVKPGRWIWDLRTEPPNLGIATGVARTLKVPRVLTVGTDMAVGKLTVTLEFARALDGCGLRARVVATGQTGLCIVGRGVALDAVRVDFAAGAVEQETLFAAEGADVVVIEGQGALPHPAASANLALLRGAMPTHLILVHRLGQKEIRTQPWAKIPPLPELIRLYEDLAECCGCFPRPWTLGVALNTAHVPDDEAREGVRSLEKELRMPVTDVLRYGCDPLVRAFLEKNN
ncbi:MAG: DUF1611 domain-containing protein [Candidatus Caldarchaeum sp.]